MGELDGYCPCDLDQAAIAHSTHLQENIEILGISYMDRLGATGRVCDKLLGSAYKSTQSTRARAVGARAL